MLFQWIVVNIPFTFDSFLNLNLTSNRVWTWTSGSQNAWTSEQWQQNPDMTFHYWFMTGSFEWLLLIPIQLNSTIPLCAANNSGQLVTTHLTLGTGGSPGVDTGGVGWWSRSLSLPTWLMLRKKFGGVGWGDDHFPWNACLAWCLPQMLSKSLCGNSDSRAPRRKGWLSCC